MAAGVLVCAVVYGLMRPRYGPISRSAYEVTIALESACGRRDAGRIDSIRRVLCRHSEMTDAERGWLLEIVKRAESGDWTEARRAARDLMLAQVQR